MPAMVQCAHGWAIDLALERNGAIIAAAVAETEPARNELLDHAERLNNLVQRATLVCESYALEAAMTN